MSVTIYHNPRCSKSRQALALLEERGVDAEVIRYLDDPPDAETLRNLIELLGIGVRELMRTGEAEYEALGLADPDLEDQALIQAMVDHPHLIQRPIVISGRRAAVGRPPEKILDLL